jgi:hypothetical protein
MKTQIKELEQVLEKMPNYFTSGQFIKKAVSLGIPHDMLKNGVAGVFLNKYCNHYMDSKRKWIKIKSVEHPKKV